MEEDIESGQRGRIGGMTLMKLSHHPASAFPPPRPLPLPSLPLSSSLRGGNGPVDLPHVRILVIGDSGCGKSAVVRRLGECVRSVEEVNSLGATTGCQTECRLHHYTGIMPTQTRTTYSTHNTSNLHHRHSHSSSSPSLFFIELFDVSGHRRYSESRDLFYSHLNGCIIMFDLMNRKSYENVKKWIKELQHVNKVSNVKMERGAESEG